MPQTPIYGFEFEDPDEQPGRTLSGGSAGLDPILAEQLEAELQRIENTPGFQFGGRLVLLANTTFDKADHPGLRAIDVQIKGGGGGAGGCGATATEASEGAGGGGGGYVRKFILASDLGASETVTIGAVGSGAPAGNNSGVSGGTTTFTITGTDDLVANGGGGGGGMPGTSGQDTAFGGIGGDATGGDLNVSGDAGGNGRVTGGAGTSIRANWGGGGPLSRIVLTSAVDSNGAGGARYGGGASGPRNGVNEAARGGADGNGGVAIVDLYF